MNQNSYDVIIVGAGMAGLTSAAYLSKEGHSVLLLEKDASCGGYGASKTAQLLTVWEIHEQLKDTGVTINAMHPGDVKTNIGQNNGLFYRLFSKYFISLLLKDPKISGEAIYYLVADHTMKDVSGKFFHLTIEETPAKHALDKDNQKKIFTISKGLTGL